MKLGISNCVNSCKSITSGSLWFCPWDSQGERTLSVRCSNFDLQVSIPNWWWNVNWLHIRHDKVWEEVALNYHIVLYWRINKIASWMTLMSSEVQNCSWRSQDGQWISVHDQSQNGPRPVTNDDLVWSPTFMTQAVRTHLSKVKMVWTIPLGNQERQENLHQVHL